MVYNSFSFNLSENEIEPWHTCLCLLVIGISSFEDMSFLAFF